MTPDPWLLRQDLGQGICRVTLNRAPVNALNSEFLMDFADLLAALAADDTVRAVILASSFKTFSAGLDLKLAQHFDLPQQQAIVRALNTAFAQQFAFPKPIIAAVNGPAIAGGLFYVLASDWRIATPAASFGLAEVRVGADFPVGPLEIARATLDPNDLRRLMLGGQPISAETACKRGIIDALVAPEDLAQQAEAQARIYADLPPKTFAAVKAQIRGPALAIISQAIASGRNAPSEGWFNQETVAAMRAMIG